MDIKKLLPSLDLAPKINNPPLSLKPSVVNINGMHDRVIFLDPRRIKPLPNNPRKKYNAGFSQPSLRELAEGIKITGQLTPAKVCVSTNPEFDAQLIDGERRLLACRLGEIMIACHVDETLDDTNMPLLYVKAAAINLQRESHNCLEKALVCKEMTEYGMSAAEIGKTLGHAESWVHSHLSLLKLSPKIQDLLVEPFEHDPGKRKQGRKKMSKLSFLIAIMLVDFPPEEQERLAQKIVFEQLSDIAARRIILNERREKGMDTKKSRPKEQFVSLEALVERSTEAFGTYMDMTPAAIAAMVATHDISEKDELSRKMNLLTGCLSDISVRIEGKKPERKN